MAETNLTPVDSEDVFALVQASIQSGSDTRPVQFHTGRFELAPVTSGPLAASDERLLRVLSEFHSRVARIGVCPPAPPTLRGRIGQTIIAGLKRLLWWHSQTVESSFESVQLVFREHLALTRALAHRLEEAVGKQVQAEFEIGKIHQELERIDDRMLSIEEQGRGLDRYAHETRAGVSLQLRQLAAMDQRPQKDDTARETRTDNVDVGLDALYLAFENRFRGSREEIKSRLAAYLPLLKAAGIGGVAMPVLDLGAGRGEWLELLRERGLTGRGVDRNSAMVELCRSHNLDVHYGDFSNYLRSLPDCSIGTVSAFHIVEHLPFPAFISLLDECLRVLKPGGLLILETPNPTNVLVGSHTFYMDPTHLHPLPPAMLHFFVEARGYSDIRCLDLHPYPEAIRLPEDGNPVAKRVNEHFYGAQDYAIIACRP
ncbi:MAG: class I SAM-dependent methyltransferase [Acidobacteriota bacterium]